MLVSLCEWDIIKEQQKPAGEIITTRICIRFSIIGTGSGCSMIVRIRGKEGQNIWVIFITRCNDMRYKLVKTIPISVLILIITWGDIHPLKIIVIQISGTFVTINKNKLLQKCKIGSISRITFCVAKCLGCNIF